MALRHYLTTSGGLAFLAFASSAVALPEIAQATLRFGYSPRISAHAWAYFNYRVDNPDEVMRTVTLVLKPRGQRNVTIHDHTFELAAGHRLDFRTLVTIGSVADYTIDLFADGNLIDREDALIRVGSPKNRYVAFVNDNVDLDYGQFSKNKGLHDKYLSNHFKAETIPHHWVGYDGLHILVLMQPDFKYMHSRQINALLDYIARGGTVMIADPHGIVAAAGTPLKKILPVTPLRIRKLDVLKAFTQIGGTELVWPEGTDFLESVPRGEGVTTLWHGDFPLTRWSRYGLGVIGVSAVNPSQKLIRTTAGNFNAIWKHILCFGGNVDYASSHGDAHLAAALDSLTGIVIPGAGRIRVFLVIYFLVVLAFVAIGILSKQRLTSWVALSLVAGIATILVFAAAQRQGRELSKYTAAILSFDAPFTEDGSSEQIVSLFSKLERGLDVKSNDVDRHIRALLPPPALRTEGDLVRTARRRSKVSNQAKSAGGKSDKPGLKKGEFVDRGKHQIVRDPLTINQRDGRNSLEGLLLRPYAPSFFAALHASEGDPSGKTPLVSWSKGGVVMEKWEIPEGINPVHGMIVCANGAYPASLSGRTCAVDPERSRAGLTVLSSEIGSLRDHLLQKRTPVPLLALFVNTSKDGTGSIPDEFAIVGREVNLISVRQDLTTEEIWVPFERMTFKPVGSRARALMFNNRWQDVQQRGTKTQYHFHSFLPAPLTRMAPHTVYIRFVGDNRSRNVKWSFALLHNAGDAEQLIPATRVEGNLHIFENVQAASVFDPADGYFRIVLESKTVKKITDPLSAPRMNTWRVQDLKIAVGGVLQPEHAGVF